MGDYTGLLEKAFEDALQRAEAADRQGIGLDAEEDSKFMTLVKACIHHGATSKVTEARDHYRRNQAAIDAALLGASDLLSKEEGVAKVKALHASLDGGEPNATSLELLQGLQTSPEFDDLRATAENSDLQAVGIGLSAGVAVIAGAFAGIEGLIDWQHNLETNWRYWYGFSLEVALTANIGVQFSFWNQMPQSGAITGWFIDLWVDWAPKPYFSFIRYMYVKQREPGGTDLSYAASTIQIPVGVALPAIGAGLCFIGKQKAWTRKDRASLTVTSNGLAQITAGLSTTLDFTLENTAGTNLSLNRGATMTINLPNFFSSTEVESMQIPAPPNDWTVTSNDGSKIVMTLGEDKNWVAGDTITFTIDDVETTSTETESGTVYVRIDTNVSHTLPIVPSTDFGIVQQVVTANMVWSIDLNTSDGFTMIGATNGTYAATAGTTDTPVEVSSASNSDGSTWSFGFIFNFTEDNGNEVPEYCAIMWKQNASTNFPGNKYQATPYIVDEGGVESSVNYGGKSTGTQLNVTANYTSAL
ncbi:MAG TPA: hypothetical protein VHI13_10445 [Candidatus Kapabacteria bacterium]|nr:hypothetical protein [Candidatus Kapabacteria bacterium]